MVIVTDFPPDSSHDHRSWSPSVTVGVMLFVNFALSFTEGCLAIERRPIPLRFALRFAAANVVPSLVWSSVSTHHVARASGIPLSALICNGEVTEHCSQSVARRLVFMKSVQAMRMAVGSYGIAWSLWHLYHESRSLTSNNDNKKVEQSLSECVVRLAPVHSQLSDISRRIHGQQHLVIVPMTNEKWTMQGRRNNAVVDWKKVGVSVKLHGERDEEQRVKVIEVELNELMKTVAHAKELKAQALQVDKALVYSVAVLYPYGQLLPTSMMDTFDVCFNPLSALLTFIASICHDRGQTHVLFVANQEEDGTCGQVGVAGDGNGNKLRQCLPISLLATGLLYRHGITTSVLETQEKEVGDDHGVDEDEAKAGHVVDTNAGVVFFLAENLAAGHAIARKLMEEGVVMQEEACFIIEESLCSQRALSGHCQAQSVLLQKANSITMEEELQGRRNDNQSTYFSVADVSDQTLQGIRQLIRQGEHPDIIQAALYRAYGTQRVVAPTRLDMFSNLDI